MKLIEYMRKNSISDDVMADRIGNISAAGVKKWKYGERSPDADRIIRIEVITFGAVGLKDWARKPKAAALTDSHETFSRTSK